MNKCNSYSFGLYASSEKMIHPKGNSVDVHVIRAAVTGAKRPTSIVKLL